MLPIVILVLVATALAATAAFYSYGRLARRIRAEPAQALPLADDGTALDRAIAPLCLANPGRTGLWLSADNLQAFEIRVLAARNAGRSLDLQYYYWLEDLTGDLLVREVAAAADRGVRVRLLIDDINTRGNDSAYLALDSHPNIQIRLFNPSRNRSGGLRRGLELALRAFRATRRMHNKAWIADGRLAIIGGRNIGDAYFDAAQATDFHDMDVLLVGEALGAAERVFDDFWNSEAAIPIGALSRPIARRMPRRPEEYEEGERGRIAEPYLKRLAGIAPSDSMAFLTRELSWSSEVEIVSDPPEKALAAGDRSWLVARIYRAIAATHSELSIVSPYFIPGRRGVEALARLSARGVSVSVLTNSLAATDVVAVHGAYAGYRRSLLRRGVALFELRPDAEQERPSLFGSKGASLHTKAFTIDGRTGFVGSFNFDPRSVSLNTEMGVLFNDPVLVEQMRAIIARQSQPASAFALTLQDDRIAWSEGSATQGHLFSEPGAGFWRRVMAAAIALLPIESQL